MLGELLHFIRTAAGDDSVHIDKAVRRRNRPPATATSRWPSSWRRTGNMRNEVALTLGTYFHQCAVEMTCVCSWHRRGGFWRGSARGWCHPPRVRRINALMMMCGHYDGSGEFAYRVGLPGKSGVGGGILVVAPGRASVAVWSPGLNARV